MSNLTVSPSRLERGIAAILLAALVIGCLLVLRPFVAAILWGVLLAASYWSPVATEFRPGTRRAEAEV